MVVNSEVLEAKKLISQLMEERGGNYKSLVAYYCLTSNVWPQRAV